MSCPYSEALPFALPFTLSSPFASGLDKLSIAGWLLSLAFSNASSLVIIWFCRRFLVLGFGFSVLLLGWQRSMAFGGTRSSPWVHDGLPRCVMVPQPVLPVPRLNIARACNYSPRATYQDNVHMYTA